MINKGLFSSDRDDWETPQDLFDALDLIFSFDLDPCASHDNHKTPQYFTIEADGLSRDWHGRVFMNPPYGRGISDWIEKAYEESTKYWNDFVVGLIPSLTDTRYWHDYVMKARYIWFIKGRIHFSGAQSAPFPSAIVIWMGGYPFDEIDRGYPEIMTYDLKTKEVCSK